MSKILKIKFNLLVLLIFLILINFSYSQTQQNTSDVFSKSPDAWRFFYDILRPSADVKCLSGNTALEKITNCIKKITRALRYFAVILFIFGLTYVAGLMVIAPFKQDLINQGKTILKWIIIGFIILFIAEKIMEAIQQLAG